MREPSAAGRLLLKLRTERGLHQSSLADATGVMRSRISKMETGERRILPDEDIEKLSAYFGVSADDFRTAEPKPPEQKPQSADNSALHQRSPTGQFVGKPSDRKPTLTITLSGELVDALIVFLKGKSSGE